MVYFVGIFLVILVEKSVQFQPFTMRNHILPRGMTFRTTSVDWYGCIESCSRDFRCISYNYLFPSNNETADDGRCQLNRCGIPQCEGVKHGRNLVYQNGAIYQQLRQDQDYCSIKGPRSCADVRKSNHVSGLYTITPAPGHTIQVYCDQTTDGGGWAVIQRRTNGSVNFFRGWDDYKRGFGNKKKEFWLGLEDIHILTMNADNEIRIDLEDCNLTSAHAQYSFFKVGDESDNYKLYLGQYHDGGTAGDSLSFQRNMNFTTFDRDNDQLDHDQNCAKLYKGAWWYKNCHYSNLNGEYKCGDHSTFADGMTWKTWRGFYYSVKETAMKIRPVDFKPWK